MLIFSWGCACGWIFTNNGLVNPLTNDTISEDDTSRYMEIKRVLVFKRPDTEDDNCNGISVVLLYTYNSGGTRSISRRFRCMVRRQGLQSIYIHQLSNKIPKPPARIARDVVCFEDSVYGVDKNANLMLLTCNNNNGRCTFQFSSIITRHSVFNLLQKRIEGINLVESAGELLMIVNKG